MAAADPAALKISGMSMHRHCWPISGPRPTTRFAAALSSLDLVLTYGGGDPVVEAIARWAPRLRSDLQCRRSRDNTTRCRRIRALPPISPFSATACRTWEERRGGLLLEPAQKLWQGRFLLGGSGWHD